MSSPEQVKKLADTLNLPDWLVEALIVEYLPCRRFLEKDAWILFDFDNITILDIEEIAHPYIILNNVTLFHNVAPDVLKTRILHGIAGLPLGTLCEATYMSIPEGQASPSCIPFLQNDLDLGDWKLFLNGYVIVFDKDENKLYQWLSSLTSENIEQYQPGQGLHNPAIFSDVQQKELRRLQTEIYSIVSSEPYPTDLSLSSSLRSRLAKLYEDVEQVRASMRKGVLEYHEQLKNTANADRGYTTDNPPQLTVFDQFRIINHSIEVRSHVEPLFFHAASQAYERAESAKSKLKTEPLTVQIADEIEAAAESIILSAICLEAYINGIGQDHLPHSWVSLERMEIREKWLEVPKRLGKTDCFKRGGMPFQDFDKLIDWRNELAHYKHEFYAPVLLGKKKQGTILNVSRIYSICNADNAKKGLETVRKMVRKINECLGLTIPRWV